MINGHKIHLGTFGTAAEAARAWDRKAIEHRGSGTVTNFDAAEYEKEMAAFKAKSAAEAAEKGENRDGKGDERASRGDDDMEETGSCGYRGIYSRSGSGKWVARLRNNKKSVYIGSYSSSKQAAQVRRRHTHITACEDMYYMHACMRVLRGTVLFHATPSM